jgi:hypothetical protein
MDNLSIRILLIIDRNTCFLATWPRLMVYDKLGQYGIRRHSPAEEALAGGVLFLCFFLAKHTKLGSPFSSAPSS